MVAGYDWGGRAACVAAALWPERCIGLVCVNSYLIQDIAQCAEAAEARTRRCPIGTNGISRSNAAAPALPPIAAAGRAHPLAAMVAELAVRRGMSRAHLGRARQSRLCRHRHSQLSPPLWSGRQRSALCGYPAQARHAAADQTVPAITLDGEGDGVAPATDGKSTAARLTPGASTEKSRAPATICRRRSRKRLLRR